MLTLRIFHPSQFSLSSNYVVEYVLKLKKISLKVNTKMSLSHQTHQPPSHSPVRMIFYIIQKDLSEIAILLSNEEIHAKRERKREGARWILLFYSFSDFSEINSWKIHFSKVLRELFGMDYGCENVVNDCVCLFVCLQISLLLNFFAREKVTQRGGNIVTLTYNWDITAKKKREELRSH
jgi:hypothetical protein